MYAAMIVILIIGIVVDVSSSARSSAGSAAATAWSTPPRRADAPEGARPSAVALGHHHRLHDVADLGGLRDVDALDHVAEEVVVLRQLAAAVVDRDEELRAVRVRTGVGHRDRAQRVLTLHRLVTELVARAAAAGALGAAALDHELRDHPVEREAVVVALPREADEVVHRVGRELRVEVHHDRPRGRW